MERILITTDSTADFDVDTLVKYGIRVNPMHIIMGDECYNDGVNITPKDIFMYVEETNTLPKTSAISTGEYINFFEKYLATYDKIIHFTISSKLSSTINNARMAANEFDGRVAIIDSKSLSTGQSLLAIKASEMVSKGMSCQDIVNAIEVLTDKVQVSFIVDTVDYLHKGGRCSGLARFASTLLKIHPSIDMKNGTLAPKEKYRGSFDKCTIKYVSDLCEEYKKYDSSRVFVTHAYADDNVVKEVTRIVKEKFHFKEVIECYAGSTITSHCGRGTLGICFIKD